MEDSRYRQQSLDQTFYYRTSAYFIHVHYLGGVSINVKSELMRWQRVYMYELAILLGPHHQMTVDTQSLLGIVQSD